MVRLGLFLYDHLGGRQRLPPTRRLDLRRDPEGAPIRDEYRTAFEYSDCWVDDARLVALNAVDARERGADIRTRTRCISARRAGGAWIAELQDVASSARETVEARALVNAAGPWVAEVLHDRAGLDSSKHLRLIKGSHIVLPRLYDGEQAYILQNDDGRVVFVIPYEQDFTLVGTTDVAFEGDPATVAIAEAETRYLCRAMSRYLRRPVSPGDVVHSYSGVRPLYDDAAASAAAVTRDYVLDLDAGEGQAPILSVFGGKITTYRRLAEHAMDKLLPHVPAPRPAPWTGQVPLPGGDLPGGDFGRFLSSFRAAYPWLPAGTARRLARAYGTRVEWVLQGANGPAGLGTDFGAGFTEAELDYLVREEWVRSADDALWRRSKLGLHLPAEARAAVADSLRHRLDPL